MGKIVTKGLYQYKDLVKNIVVYIGKDSNIHKNKRDYQHNLPSRYNHQKINQVIQNNPERYEYSVICEYSNITDEELNWLEIMEIMKHKFLYGERPKFNFTVGGETTIGYRKPYENFEYTVVKAGFQNGKQKYGIFDRDNNFIKRGMDKDVLDKIAEKLNNGLLTEEEVKSFKYTVVKAGFQNGKQKYCILDQDNNSIKISINKDVLDKIAEKLNNGSLTEEEVKSFKYTVAKAGLNNNGKQRYVICDRNQNPIKGSINKEVLDEIANALNNGLLTEKEIKKSRGVKKILEKI